MNGRPSTDYIWLLVSDDEFELPLIVADSVAELSLLSGRPVGSIRSSVCRYERGRTQGRIRRVLKD